MKGHSMKTLYLDEKDVLNGFPEHIGRVKLDYSHYPGRDLYSDGTIEDELLYIVKETSPVEYPGIIESRNSWPILYHLSPLRGNIIDWLPIDKSHKVLEIGAGCGAITSRLSEKAGEVTCVDLSAKRSHINAWRNQDKDNITIHVGNFSDIEPSLPTDYDYICLIGVFEYGQSYIQSREPYEDFLKIMLRHVKEDGRLVIAIENKFGLKYFAGCKEDHTGTFFSGLEGYPEGGSARTFTRPGLEKIMKSCGVNNYSFYYPYPDYKFPTEIYSDRRLPGMGELTNNLRNFDRHRLLLFNEKYVFDGVIKDNLFDIFANSYLVVVGKEIDVTYARFSNDRAPQYALRTDVLETGRDKVVCKTALTEEAWEHIRQMERSCALLKKRYEGSALRINDCRLDEQNRCAVFPFERGVTLESLMDQCLEEDNLEGFYALFDQYLDCISYGEECKIGDYDLIFANILVDGESWTVIDYEWMAHQGISTKEIAFRAVYCYVLEEEKRNKLDFDRLMERLGVTPAEAEEYREKELKFQKMVTGKRKSMGEIRAAMGTYAVDAVKLLDGHLQEILNKRIQIYEDRGNGFSEENSYYLPDVYTDEYKIEAEIAFDGNVTALRIDPADKSCMVKITGLCLNGQEVSLSKKILQTNGKTVKDGTYVFVTSDPNLVFQISALPRQGENTLTITMQLSPLPMEMAEDMAGSIRKLF